MIVGITGSSGSGKSLASKVFEKRGFHIIDLDKLSRETSASGSLCVEEIADKFGKEILLSDGGLNRRALGEIVFRNRDKLELLNGITHKYILEAMNVQISRVQGDILIDAPLLFEANLDKICDFTVGIIAQREEQIRRICERDGISEETAVARLDKQHTNDYFEQKCSYIIENSGNEEELAEKVNALIEKRRN